VVVVVLNEGLPPKVLHAEVDIGSARKSISTAIADRGGEPRRVHNGDGHVVAVALGDDNEVGVIGPSWDGGGV